MKKLSWIFSAHIKSEVRTLINFQKAPAYPIENMTFSVRAESIEQFVAADTDIWTKFLSEQAGFLSKEIWITEPCAGKCLIKTVTRWLNQESWDAVDKKELQQRQKAFDAVMPSGVYELVCIDYLESRYFQSLSYPAQH